MNLGIAIKTIRKELGISQKGLADLCSISQTSLSQIESGVKNIGFKTFERLCATLDMPPSLIYMLGIEKKDIAEDKRAMYDLLYPSITTLVLRLVRTGAYAAEEYQR